jgi:hypothetical protein
MLIYTKLMKRKKSFYKYTLKNISRSLSLKIVLNCDHIATMLILFLLSNNASPTIVKATSSHLLDSMLSLAEDYRCPDPYYAVYRFNLRQRL